MSVCLRPHPNTWHACDCASRGILGYTCLLNVCLIYFRTRVSGSSKGAPVHLQHCTPFHGTTQRIFEHMSDDVHLNRQVCCLCLWSWARVVFERITQPPPHTCPPAHPPPAKKVCQFLYCGSRGMGHSGLALFSFKFQAC